MLNLCLLVVSLHSDYNVQLYDVPYCVDCLVEDTKWILQEEYPNIA